VANALAQRGIVFEDLQCLDAKSLQKRQKAILALAELVWSADRLVDMAREPAMAA